MTDTNMNGAKTTNGTGEPRREVPRSEQDALYDQCLATSRAKAIVIVHATVRGEASFVLGRIVALRGGSLILSLNASNISILPIKDVSRVEVVPDRERDERKGRP